MVYFSSLSRKEMVWYKINITRRSFIYDFIRQRTVCCAFGIETVGLNENVHNKSSNGGFNFQMGISASQMHNNSLNHSLNFKTGFENLKPRSERKCAQ